MATELSPYVTLRRRIARLHHRTSDDHPTPAQPRRERHGQANPPVRAVVQAEVDHVLADLAGRFDAVLEAVESQEGWVTNRVTPGKIILGELGGIETGIRQLIRRTPLETVRITLPSGKSITAPTPEETLRVKAFLIIRRNQTRDYLDVAALADRRGSLMRP